MTVDCSGVKELGTQGEVEFSRDVILPIETSGEKAGMVDETKTKIIYEFENENGTLITKAHYRVKGGLI